MTVKIKICGIKTHEVLQATLEAGADYFGLVFYPPSPRNVSEETARDLVDAAGSGAKSVALLVDPSNEDVLRINEAVAPDYIQLHGNETPDRIAEIGKLCGCKLIKAVHIAAPGDSNAAAAYTGLADIILFDAKPTADASTQLPGGNGVPFDWRLLTGIKQSDSFMLSGGLSPDNVAQAIELTKAPIVDVSSGVERAPGEKDAGLIRQFIERAKSAAEI
jgi:phosphoribosylanthranilate isomerase